MDTDRSIIAVIPARYASQRLPGKPLTELNGRTMIQRVYEQVRQARLVHSVIVATDDERIAESVAGLGGHVVMTDPELPSGSDRVAAAVAGVEAEIVVNVQGDEPLIPPAMIDETIQGLLEIPEAEVATPARLITEVREIDDPNCVKVVTDRRGRALYFSRSPIPYLRDREDRRGWPQAFMFFRHFGLYAYRRPVLEQFVRWEKTPLESAEQLEQLRLLENGVWIQIIRTTYESIAVDTAADAERVRKLLLNKT
jgi:3-deoxy-manno-octulosonate cytidylyltransferase (CMP-KDO synthetase)